MASPPLLFFHPCSTYVQRCQGFLIIKTMMALTLSALLSYLLLAHAFFSSRIGAVCIANTVSPTSSVYLRKPHRDNYYSVCQVTL